MTKYRSSISDGKLASEWRHSVCIKYTLDFEGFMKKDANYL